MYEAYWQLDTKPFENTSDARFYYPGESHQGAMLKLRYAIENRRGAALLTGATGLGKSMLVHALARQLPEAYAPVVHLVFPQMPPDQLVAYLADELTTDFTSHTPAIRDSVRRIEQFLTANANARRHAVAILDEAQLLCDPRMLETVRLLLNFESNGTSAMTILLIGQPSILPYLERMPEFDERIGVKCLLRRFTLDESVCYISHRLTAAGAHKPIFDQEAMETVHRLTQGVARRINRLCDLALLIGFAEERPIIGAEQIEAVSEELVTVTPE